MKRGKEGEGRENKNTGGKERERERETFQKQLLTSSTRRLGQRSPPQRQGLKVRETDRGTYAWKPVTPRSTAGLL